MKLIYYDEASQILNRSIDAVRHAAVRGDLTRVGTEGNRQRLIKEQVMLFQGINPRTGNKKWIQYEALSSQEQALWNRYAEEATRTPGIATQAIDEEAVREMVRQELLQQRLEEIRKKAADIKEEEERFRKEYPFLRMREAIPA